jgi:urea transporter/murein DD-endopeptidase MepM/ murein hydrolase activator NlpD
MSPALSATARFADSICYSYAQILFGNRRWFGVALLAATFFHPVSGGLALAAVILSNLLAHGLKFDVVKIQSGFYGFTGILLGVAYGFYFTMTPFLLAVFPIFVLLCFFVAAALEHYFAAAFNLPGLSLPFMLALYITLIFLRNYTTIPVLVHPLEALPALGGLPQAVQQYFHSLALILFQTHALAGVLIAAALLVFSRVFFVLSVAGFFAAYLAVALLLPDQQSSLSVLCGLNGILIALALGGALVIPSRKSLVLVILAVIMAVVFTGVFIRIFRPFDLPVMVLPFNLVALGTIYSLKFRQKTSGLVLLYFIPGSPEENYYYHHTAQARFKKISGTSADLPFSGEWTVAQGHSGRSTHKDDWKYAWDFVVHDEQGKSHRNSGISNEDYHCYRVPVTAPLAGEVVRVVDGIPDNAVGNVNLRQNWGNTVVLKHWDRFYSALSHLEPGSVRVQLGMRVERGQILATCGSSGRSPEPHLHFQFQATDAVGAATLSYPFGCYVADDNGTPVLQATTSPAEGERVQNLPLSLTLQKALTFNLHDSLQWKCCFGTADERVETWEVKVDIYNIQYLESSAGAWANFFSNGKIFYLTDFRGNRRSALYYFYLTALQIPLGVMDRLRWTDQVPLSKATRTWLMPLTELLLLFAAQMEAVTQFRLGASEAESTIVESEMTLRGRGIFEFYARQFHGSLEMDADGRLAVIEYREGTKSICRFERMEMTTENE